MENIWFVIMPIGVIVFFFVVRHLVLWYWKINRIETLLERIEKNTRKEGVVYVDDDKFFN